MQLVAKWQELYNQIKQSKAPQKLLSEENKTATILRDLLSDSFRTIAVNDAEMAENIRQYVTQISPEHAGIVQYYGGGKSIFDQYNVTKQIKSSFGKTATMPSGAYLVIEHTEAMHVIDVNSGPKIVKSEDHEGTALSVNIEATQEIARQLRLRDLGGIITIDFIDVRNPEHKKVIYDRLVEAMSRDRAQHTILPLTKFNLMQITRERVRPQITISTAENCPACKGSGKLSPTILITDHITRDLEFILNAQHQKKITITLHPYVHAFLLQGFINTRMRWFFKHKKWIFLRSDNNHQISEYHFIDHHDDEIRLD